MLHKCNHLLLTLEKHIYEHLGLKAQYAWQDPQMQQQPPEVQAQMLANASAIVGYSNSRTRHSNRVITCCQASGSCREQKCKWTIARPTTLTIDSMRNQENTNIARERIQSTEDIAGMRAQIALQRNARIK